MKASELISKLQEEMNTYGDLEVIADFDSDYSTGDIEDVCTKKVWHCSLYQTDKNYVKERILIKC